MSREHNEMTSKTSSCSYRTHPARATCKLLFLIALAIAALAASLSLIDADILKTLKHSLNVPTLILLVVIINLASFVLFLAAYTAWQWVRRDLKPPRMEQRYRDES